MKAKIIYERNNLQVLLDTTSTGQYTFCFSLDNVNLKEGYYFGVTAATGGLADYHDIYSFETRNLDPSAQKEYEQPRRGWFEI